MITPGLRLVYAAAIAACAVAAGGCLLLNWRYEIAGSSGGGGSSSTTTTGTGGTITCTGVTFQIDLPCSTCVADSCCPELAACAPGTACDTLLGCVRGCLGDTACLTGCVGSGAGAKQAAEALLTCYQKRCSADPTCGVTCGDAPITDGKGGRDLACGACYYEHCCSEFAACKQDTTCWGCLTMDPAPCNSADAGVATFKTAQACLPRCNGSCWVCTTSYGSGNALCDLCLTTSCCQEYADCDADFFNCSSCLYAYDPTCDIDPLYSDAITCKEAHCSTECAGL